MPSEQAGKLNEILRSGMRAVDMTMADQRATGEHQEDLTLEPIGEFIRRPGRLSCSA